MRSAAPNKETKRAVERLSRAALPVLLMAVAVLVLAPAAQAKIVVGQGAGAAAWSRAFKVSPFGSARGAELDDKGVLRVWWEGDYEIRPRHGVSLTTGTGKMTSVKRSALDRYTEKPVGGNPAYEEPALLGDGRWLRCAITVNRPRTQAHIFMLVYSHGGALVKRLLIASQSEDTTGQIAPLCHVAAAGEQAVVEFTQETPPTNRYEGNRQIYVVRVLPGLKVTAPLPLLPPGEAQQTLLGDNITEQVSLSPSGWIAVSWAQDNITRETDSGIEQRWQFQMRWISPTGSVSPAIALGPVQGGRLCNIRSLRCGGLVPIPAVEAIGPERALVVFGSPHLESEEVNDASVTATQVISPEEAFLAPESSQVAAGGHTVVVTWGGSVNKHGHCGPIRVVQWRGRWSQPVVVGRPVFNECLYDPSAHANSRGQASVIWFHQISVRLANGQLDRRPVGYVQGVFNF
jgi:hypothetical protein